MKKVALFPGTFDPFTSGHEDIVHRGLAIFDEIVVAIGVNAEKKHLFDLAERMAFINALYKDEPRVEVTDYEGLTAVFADEIDARFILRGLRTTQDFTYEQQIAHVNEDLVDDVQSVFVISDQRNASISSTIVRDLIRFDGNFEPYVPSEIYKLIMAQKK